MSTKISRRRSAGVQRAIRRALVVTTAVAAALIPVGTGAIPMLSGAALAETPPTPTTPPTAPPITDDATATIGGSELDTRGTVVDPAATALPGVSATAWLVADANTGQVLAAQDPHGRYWPASVLKTLTAVSLIPVLAPNDLVTVTRDDENTDGTKVGILAGQTYTNKDLFTAMLVMSANDAANGLGTSYGSHQLAIDRLNQVAHDLQADDTYAASLNGLDADGQYTSAYDLALIARAGLAMPAFRDYIGTMTYEFPNPKNGTTFQIQTHDHLLLDHFPGALGIKNGYTVHARCSFVGAAERDGHTLIATVLRADPACHDDAAKLLDWGFANDGTATPVGTLVTPLSQQTPSASPSASNTSASPADASATGSAPGQSGQSGHPASTASTAAAAAAGGGSPGDGSGDGGGVLMPLSYAAGGLFVTAAGLRIRQKRRLRRRRRSSLGLPRI